MAPNIEREARRESNNQQDPYGQEGLPLGIGRLRKEPTTLSFGRCDCGCGGVGERSRSVRQSVERDRAP